MEIFQTLFHQEWRHLHDPHVRALAWMLTSPSLLERSSPLWNQQTASLQLPDDAKLRAWLTALDQNPSGLLETLALHKQRRLGHYAENLLSFYLRYEGTLYAHGLQVHEVGASTLGEFDFLLRQPDGLHHLELATKFYLFEDGGDAAHQADLFDYLGPNLADTLGAKMDKIFRQQLALSQHRAAQELLPEKLVSAKALIKGWLFYRASALTREVVAGIAEPHCRGYWWTLSDIRDQAFDYALILPRLQWLAPAQAAPADVLARAQSLDALGMHFQRDSSPVMLAIMRNKGELMQECYRGMVVPDDWLSLARESRKRLRSG